MKKHNRTAFRFVEHKGMIDYCECYPIKRYQNKTLKTFYRDVHTNLEYPENMVFDNIDECKKQKFVRQYNERMRSRYEANIIMHPEDDYKFEEMSFEEIIMNIKTNKEQ